ncbi:MAG: hypothetical protein CMB06_00725 [Euryarchaeota archaeon]|nr:hypothetical protein [Euryarchaeota archaeon]|tara:strand:- start:1647 stop:1862 length:216 start_codon:yes stop_codon:yes gene_type:complete
MKYSTDLAERLYKETPDEEAGSVEELGWFGRFNEEKVILTEDSQGFVDAERFDTSEKLQEVWDLLALSSNV